MADGIKVIKDTYIRASLSGKRSLSLHFPLFLRNTIPPPYTVYACWIVSMSRFFNLTTDSTCPFSVCSSLNLAISALLLASSAIWFSSVKWVRSVNILVSGACKPCNVLCACAHWSSRCSFPKSFCLVNAILCSITRSHARPLKA